MRGNRIKSDTFFTRNGNLTGVGHAAAGTINNMYLNNLNVYRMVTLGYHCLYLLENHIHRRSNVLMFIFQMPLVFISSLSLVRFAVNYFHSHMRRSQNSMLLGDSSVLKGKLRRYTYKRADFCSKSGREMVKCKFI